MSKITKIKAREILDSRGNPTVEVSLETESGVRAVAGVPSGASTGKFEALELRDGDERRFLGKGVLKAVQNVNERIYPVLSGMEVSAQRELDEKMLKIDSTENKSNLGANAILGVSLAAARAAAIEKKQELFEYIAELHGREKKSEKIPFPMFNVLNGGEHSDSGLAVQEFKIVPSGIQKYDEQLRAGSEIFHALQKVLADEGYSTGVGDEGGFAPHLEKNERALEYISEAVSKAGYVLGKDVFVALDVAASSFWDEKKKFYDFKPDKENVSRDGLFEIYEKWIQKFSIISIEDGLHEEDWSGWEKMNNSLGQKVMLIGDDLLVTNVKRLKEALESDACNAVLVKPNQIGTLSETLDFVKLAQENGLKVVVSHRSGETTDSFISDLAVGVGAEFMKTGAPNRGERLAKYNRLLEISNRFL